MSTAQPPLSNPPEPKDVHVYAGPTDGSAFTGRLMGDGSDVTEIHDTHPLHVQLPYDLTPRADKATADPQLQKFVNHATLSKDVSRKKVCLETFGENYDRLRELGGKIKQHTLDHLDHYLEQFIAAAGAAGTQVHFADGPEDAKAICIDIAKRNNVKLIVKSKSMVTEETHLASEMTKAGITIMETDLGEFILQLDQDDPSHIVQPMIHKDR